MSRNLFSLEGKVALITGASYGIGFAIACAMQEAGATIVFNDIRQELVDKGLAAYAEKFPPLAAKGAWIGASSWKLSKITTVPR